MIKFKPAVRRIENLASRWLLPLPISLGIPARFAQPSRLPLIMISQVQRSGGTLFSQLLDGHPRLLVFPGEMHIAKPKSDWPSISLRQPATIIFRKLVDHRCIEYAKRGYSKTLRGSEREAFNYDVKAHHQQFCAMFKTCQPKSAREVLDLFFTSFFHSWQRRTPYPLAQAGPSYYCGFAAGFSANADGVAGFFADYLDGYLISILRRPDNWLPSALNKETSNSKFGDAGKALSVWRKSARAMEDNFLRYPGRVILIEFGQLIADTQNVMRKLCGRLGIVYDDCFTIPTFDGAPIESNSSFRAVKGGVDSEVLVRKADEVPGMEHLIGLYQRVSAMCL